MTEARLSHGRIRLFASLRQGSQGKTSHRVGYPPGVNRATEDSGTQLPSPDVVVLEQESEGNCFLYRLTKAGLPGGDTWHQSIDDAKHQADFEYGEALGEWREVPPEVPDAQEFALAAVRS